NSSNERKLYEYGINNFFGHSFLPINTNALSRLIIEPTKIIGQRFSSKKMVTISPNKNYNIQYAVESSNSQFLAFSYLPKYIKFNFYDTNTSLNIPTESCTSIQFSPHNNYIVITHPAANKYMFSLWNIVHLDIIRDVVNGFITLSQSRFLYRLFLGKLNKVNIVIDQNDPDYMVYLSLPEVLKILVDRFLPFNLTSDLAQKDLKETH
ncbi:MAG TPA: hypothetical protein VHX42_01540, partial [Candidatus Babeliales bacterium]|nr:hypothetical protein [Candidatus Babeliales bacterium]